MTLVLALLGGGSGSAVAQVTLDDYKKLRINEILASNDAVLPQSRRCRHEDMVEIYNGSDKELLLDDPNLGYVRITDHSRYDVEPFNVRYLSFRNPSVQAITPGQRIVVFCDENENYDNRSEECNVAREGIDMAELHAPFRLDNDGETLTLEFVPEDTPENPVTLHEVTFPPLPQDVSWARTPEDPENLDSWVFTKSPSFGDCTVPLASGWSSCLGAANPSTGDDIEPNLELIDYGTNNPAANEAVPFRIRVTDEKVPDEENLVAVEVHYRVDGGDWQAKPMEFVHLLADAERPLELWSIWEGAIPGQSAGSEVEFYFTVRDADGLEDSQPRLPMCPPGIGSCSPNDTVEEGLGPGCVDPAGCGTTGDCQLLQDCRRPLAYRVESTYDGPLVITEVIPNNETILEDETEDPTLCETHQPTCTYDDFIEIYNPTFEEVDLEGLVLAKGPFRPERGWRFEFGSTVPPLGRIIVWVDGDGVDPDPLADPPDPANPNNPAQGEFHTDFRLDATRDEIFLFEPVNPGEFDPTKQRFQVIDGARWGTSGRYFESSFDEDPTVPPLAITANSGVRSSIGRLDAGGVLIEEALSRFPEERSGGWFVVSKPNITPGKPNVSVSAGFRRGDSNADGAADVTDPISTLSFLFLGLAEPTCMDAADVDDNGMIEITDPISLLTHLFLGGAVPPPPGKNTCGPDPTPDQFPECDYPSC